MEANAKNASISPPKLMAALQAGFNDTAGHIYLILFPVLLDLFLWLGPRFGVKAVFKPQLDAWLASLAGNSTNDVDSFILANRAVLDQFLEQFNLAGLLRTLPIGIPSLVSSGSGLSTPLGNQMVIEGANLFGILLAAVCFLAVGLVMGSLYFSGVAQASQVDKMDFRGGVIVAHIIQTFILTFALLMVLFGIAIPTLLILSVLTLIAPGLAQLGGLVLLFFLFWLLLPLIFSPHGIFAAGLNAFTSVYTSVRLVRFFLPGTGTFLVALLVMYEGLNVLWRIPPSDSWMMMVGILGHGFIATSLLSASFAYYQGGMRWMNENLARLMNNQTKAV